MHLQITTAACIAVLRAEHSLCGGPCAVTIVKSRWRKPGLAYSFVCLSDAELVNPRQTEPSVNTGRSPEKCAQQRPKRQSSASQRSSSLPPSNRKANTPSKRCVPWARESDFSRVLLLFHCAVSLTECAEHGWGPRAQPESEIVWEHRYCKPNLCQAWSRGRHSSYLRVKVMPGLE